MSAQLEFTKKLAIKAGDKALQRIDKIKSVKTKSDARDVYTDMDIATERLIVSAIQKKFPGHNIIREEEDNIDSKSDYTWIIDPIDGTKYYTAGVNFWTTAIGLWYKNKPLLGVIYNPATRECFYAEKGKGAFCNSKKIKVSNVNKLSEAIITIDIQNIDRLIYKKIVAQRFDKIVKNIFRFRALGGSNLAICYLAQGAYDAYFDLTGQEDIVDFGSSLIIASEAGARVTNLEGKFPGMEVSNLVITNGKIHNQLLKLLN